ncbi:Uu.00g103210.m01.CDS01 [Anthostomella pinea]|uniref:Uu.00g103210.m01.CDS01 n=1 Tax=Anthostomella pinea TaxID=933095 RepID=A0AAI8VDK2_9PEZI|nr:Uu.00g103210.m01.CDS01 [Anthostomella pinea]
MSETTWARSPEQDGESYEKWQPYGQSKTANCLMAVSLAEKLAKRHLRAYSLHPGVIHSNLGTPLDWTVEMGALIDELTGRNRLIDAADMIFGNPHVWWAFSDFMFLTHDGDAATCVYAAFDPELDAVHGYLVDCRIADPAKDTVNPWAFSIVDAELLWKLSEKLVDQKLCY